MLKRAARRRKRSERGAELIEFAIAFPILFFLIAGLVDFGVMFHHYEVITNAAREGARLSVLSGYTTADVQSRVASYVSAAGLPATPTTTVTVTGVTLASGTTIAAKAVQVNYPYTFFIVGPAAQLVGQPAWGGITLHAIAIMRQEVPGA